MVRRPLRVDWRGRDLDRLREEGVVDGVGDDVVEDDVDDERDDVREGERVRARPRVTLQEDAFTVPSASVDDERDGGGGTP